MARLEPVERNGRVGADRDAAHGARFPVDPRGHVHGEHSSAPICEGVDVPNTSRREPVDVARQPRAVKRVDDEIGSAGFEGFRAADFAREALRRERGVAPERRARTEQKDFNPTSPIREPPRGDKTVAAIASGPAQNFHPPARPHAL